jgi:predicted NAD/FAD-binding protein
MSFAVSLSGGTFEYQARALGLIAQPSNLVKPSYMRMMKDIARFAREATSAELEPGMSTGAFLAAGGYSESFRRDFLLPMLACIWSSSLDAMLEYPAETMIGFLDNHGLLDVLHRPRWRTVTGGSREYVRKLTVPTAGTARLATPVVAVLRDDDGVRVVDANGGIDRFDEVVFATHADTTLRILGDGASPEERRVLSAFGYQRNVAVLHHDVAFMPRRRRVWSSWNYLAEEGRGRDRERVSLSYWMNRLQNLNTARPAIVTLNPLREPANVVSEHVYDHPAFDTRAVQAQTEIPSLQGVRRTWFAGSYCGHGFHEDALRSGLTVAAALGAAPPWWPAERELAGAAR